MAIKKLQTNFTTPEQAKKLLELGVPADSADCVYTTWKNDTPSITYLFEYKFSSLVNDPDIQTDVKSGFMTITPCWSDGRLMEIYDICFPDNGDWPNTQKWSKYTETYNLLKYAIDCIETAVEKDYIDFSKLEE